MGWDPAEMDKLVAMAVNLQTLIDRQARKALREMMRLAALEEPRHFALEQASNSGYSDLAGQFHLSIEAAYTRVEHEVQDSKARKDLYVWMDQIRKKHLTVRISQDLRLFMDV